MYFTNIEYLHHHNNKPTFIKLIFSILLAIILLSIIQPIWLFKFHSEDNTKKIEVKKEINWYTTFFITLVFIILIYFCSSRFL